MGARKGTGNRTGLGVLRQTGTLYITPMRGNKQANHPGRIWEEIGGSGRHDGQDVI